MSIREGELVIGEDNWQKHCLDVFIDNKRMSRGLVPRDYTTHPVGCYARGYAFGMRAVDDVPLIPMEEWPERIAEREAKRSQISDVRLTANGGRPIPSLDQDGYGYCWTHSATMALILLRALAGLAYVRLSAFAIACIIKNYQDQGGWGAAALDFLVNGFTRGGRHYLGVPSVDFWPEKSTSRANDNEQTWSNALLHTVTEGFIDVEAAAYDRQLSAQQVGSCSLANLPVIGDFNWWGHSVCIMDIVDVYPDRSARDIRRYGTRIINSWKDAWGVLGTGVLKDSQAFPDGATCPRVPKISNA